MSSESESDVEMRTNFVKKVPIKMPKSPTEHLLKERKKLSTKIMIYSALEELKSRKGTSLQAIKKYMTERYGVDTEKMNFYIKKQIKMGVESGEIIQTKGLGASGSFRLAPRKPEKKKKKEKKEKEPKKVEKTEKGTEKSEKPKKKIEKENKKSDKKTKTNKKPESKTKKEKLPEESESLNVTKQKKIKIIREEKKESKTDKTKMVAAEKKVAVAKTKVAKDNMRTPAKKGKKQMMKRKSIGSIIKPPKMKPNKT